MSVINYLINCPNNGRNYSSGASRGATDRVANLKVRKGTLDALKQGSGALAK